MKVKIKKGKKSKEFNLIKSWSDVTLETWLKLIECESSYKTEEASKTIELLSDIPKETLRELELSDVAKILGILSELQKNTKDTKLKNIIEINKVEYAFHPNLSEITLGEYADIEQLIKVGIEKNLPELMAILYRPVKEKHKNGVYIIDAYDGDVTMRAEEMKLMSAIQVQTALFFFFLLGRILLKILPSYLTKKPKEMKMQ
tara:strand:+ start:147 stop:752 length:606 start_codon:yes stop_codon:yes gene_type:complete